MSTSGSPGDSSNDSASKQGILSFFQNIKTKRNDIVEVMDSDDEKTTAGDKELMLAPQLQSWIKDVPEKNKPLHAIKDLKEVIILPESTIDGRCKEKEQKKQKHEELKEKEAKKHGELKRQKETAKRQHEVEKLKIENEKKAREEEKEAKKQQREELKRQKEAAKQLREAEKLKIENGKKAREEEKEAKKQQREELKRQKEAAKQLREAEKLKIENEKKARESEKRAKEEAKERSQSRINNFFGKKVTDSNKPTFVQSDYEKFFLPFYSKEGFMISPLNQLSSAELNESRNRIDSLINQKKDDDQVLQWLDSRLHSVKVSLPIAYQATSLLQQMTSKEKSDQELQCLLSLIPHKYIKFYENVRPPYMGTYSKDMILPANDPFSTRDTGYNYDFDSDLEWANEEEEEAEGGVEDLQSGLEEEEEEEEESEGEFDGFLDPEDRERGTENKSHKRKFIGPLIPKVCLRKKPEQMDEDDRNYFNMVAIQYLIEEQPFPINPTQFVKHHVETVNRTLMDSQNDSSTPSTSPGKKRKSLISEPRDLLRLFDEIQDSTFSLGTVTEIAQKNLPLYSKQIIKNTVKEFATRTSFGTPRRWTIKNPQYWDQLRSDYNNIK